MKKIALSSGVLALLVSIFWISSASACGCGVMITSHDDGSWAYGEDSTERSYINLDKGSEKLIISLDIRSTSRDSVLVIPIPAQPATVKADVLTETPDIQGYDVEERAQQNISGMRDLLLATQIYPLVSHLFPKTEMLTNTASIPQGFVLTNAPTGGVTVYQHLEKEGMVAEVLSATNSDALYSYLTEKGLKVEKDSIPVFRDYIDNDFSFIVSWINPYASGGNARGILATFPADKMYYPLKPGGAYSGSGTTKTVTVIGHATPELYESIKAGTRVGYFHSDSSLSSKDFFDSNGGFDYTKVIINVRPGQLTQDLYISSHAPLRIYNAQFIDSNPVAYTLILLLLISILSTGIAAGSLFAFKIPSAKLFGLVIASCLTIVGTIIGSRIFLSNKRFKYVLISSISFVIITLCISYAISALYQHAPLQADYHSYDQQENVPAYIP